MRKPGYVRSGSKGYRAAHYVAEYDGHTFTRTIAREYYTYVLLAIYKIAEARKECEARRRKEYQQSLNYMKHCAEGGHAAQPLSEERFTAARARFKNMTYAQYQRECQEKNNAMIADAHAWLAKSESAHVAEALKSFDEECRTDIVSSDGKLRYRVILWCRQLKLAENQAKLVKLRGAHEVIILPARKLETEPTEGNTP